MTVLVVGCTHTSDISQNPISPSIHTCSGVKGYSGGVYMQTSANYLKPVEDVKYIRTEHFG